MEIGVAITAIPPRGAPLAEAINSVYRQTLEPAQITVAIDTKGQGASVTRNRAWHGLDTPWVTFLDDDDEMESWHLASLARTITLTGADIAYPHYNIVGPTGANLNREDPHTHQLRAPFVEGSTQPTICCLWRREALEAVGGFPTSHPDGIDQRNNRIGEDAQAVWAAARLGYRVVPTSKRSFRWHWTGENTSGISWR